MSTYETFNEMLFDSYCKTCIDRAIRRGRREKTRRGRREVSLEAATGETLNCLLASQASEWEETVTFRVHGAVIDVRDPDLGQALSFLPVKHREVVLMSYFLELTDQEIADRLRVSRSAVQRRRVNGVSRLRDELGAQS